MAIAQNARQLLERIQFVPGGIRGKNISYRPELDGIRALSIVVVLLHHLGYLNSRGFLGVDIFFTLSGYLITQVLLATVAKGKPLRTFYRRRLARLYPIMAMSVIIASLVIGYESPRDNQAILASLFYYKNFLHWGDLFGPFWSLSAEEQFYLIFPIALIAFLRFTNKRIFSIFLLTLIAITWGYVLKHNYPHYSWNQDGVFNLVIFRPTMILVGCLISLNYQFCRDVILKFNWIAVATLIALIYCCITMQFPGFAALATGLFILLLDQKVTDQTKALRYIKKVLQSKPLQTVGVLSYSIYIWHMPVIFYFFWHGQNPHDHLVSIFLIVLTIAVISFYLVEVPLQRLLSGVKRIKPGN